MFVFIGGLLFIDMKRKMYTVCLGIGLNMFLPEFYTIIENEITKSSFHR